MPCFHPVTAYPLASGGVTFNQLRTYRGAVPLQLSCGQCTGCRLERARQWAVRSMHEASQHEDNCFLTLTFADEHLPHDYSVDVRHLQLFMKRLRKTHGKARFMACGEYGETTLRPHYHILLFGTDFPDRRLHKTNDRGDQLFTSAALDRLWPYGHGTIGAVTFDSAGYVARYTLKKRTGKLAASHYLRVHPLTGEVHQVRPEFLVMSRRPGIGATWLDRFRSDVFPSDQVIVNGHPTRPPRFYDKQLSEEDLAAIKQKRKRNAFQHKENNTKERLAIREEVLDARLTTLKRNLT